MKLNISQVGKTVEQDGKVLLLTVGDMPPDCIVVFMDEESWEKLEKYLKESGDE